MKPPNQNNPRFIIIHCSATPEGRDITATDIDHYHRTRGFAKIGYHYVIRLDGTIEKGRDESEIGAHCYGKNRCSIGICYIGGIKRDGTPADTRSPAQKAAMVRLLRELRRRYPQAAIHGHRDFAAKACPSFNATAEYRTLAGITGFLFVFSTTSCKTSKTSSSLSYDHIDTRSDIRTEQMLRRLINDSVEIHILSPRAEIVNTDSSRIIVGADQIRLTRRRSTVVAEQTTSTRTDTTSATAQTIATAQSDTRPDAGIPLLWPVVILTATIATSLIIKKLIAKWKHTLS